MLSKKKKLMVYSNNSSRFQLLPSLEGVFKKVYEGVSLASQQKIKTNNYLLPLILIIRFFFSKLNM